MNLHPDVISDLVTLHQLGEASEATRKLLAEQAPQALHRAQLSPPVLTAPPAAQLETVRRLRGHIRWRGTFIGLGIFYTLLPFSFYFSAGKLHFFFLRDSPHAATACFLLAAVWWFAGYMLNRRANAGL
jgi:hypothetical protein